MNKKKKDYKDLINGLKIILILLASIFSIVYGIKLIEADKIIGVFLLAGGMMVPILLRINFFDNIEK